MSWLSILGIGKNLFKSKWFWLFASILIVSLYIKKYTTLVTDLHSAYNQVQMLSASLEATNKSLVMVEKELSRVDEFNNLRIRNEKQTNENKKLMEKSLDEERHSNERLNECWDVPIDDSFTDRLQSKPEDKN